MSRPLGTLNPALLAQCPDHLKPADADHLPIEITTWGTGSRPVLMVHGGVQGGIGGGPVNFLAQQPLSDRGWRLRLMDRPGFGGSPSRGPDDMEADAILIAERLDEGSHLIGHSFGGAGALLAAARRPAAVRSLILIEPALQPMLTADPSLVDDGELASATSGIVQHLLSSPSPGAFALSFARSMGRSEEGGDNVSVANIATDPGKASALGCALLRSLAASPTDMLDAAHIVRSAGIPVLVVSGGYSEGQEITCRAVARATGGRHAVVECGSHFVQQANPAVFNDVAHDFMETAEPRNTSPVS